MTSLIKLLSAATLALALAAPTAPAQIDPTGPQTYHGARVKGPLPDVPEDDAAPRPALPKSTPVPYAGPQLALQHRYIGRDAAEPTIGVDPDGVAYMTAGAFDSPLLPGSLARQEIKQSTDGGLTWKTIEVPFYLASGEPTTLDPYVWVDNITGRVFALTLLGADTYIAYSDDKGATWDFSQVTSPGVNDHQTIVTGKPPEGVPQAQTSDAFPNVVYYCVNHVSDSRCALSRDGGAVWQPTGGPAYHPGPSDGDDCVGGLHGHVDTDPDGLVLLPAGHCGHPQLSVSADAGLTWQRHIVSPEIGAADVHTAVAADKAGNLYYIWYDNKWRLPFLAVSTDHGETWGEPIMIAPPGVHEANFPEIVAGEAGRIAITFPGGIAPPEHHVSSSDKSSGRPWFTYVIVSDNALDPNPVFHSNTAGPRNDPVHRGNCDGRCVGMFDFMDIQISPQDGAVWATATDTCTAEDDCNVDDTVQARDAEGVAVRQIGGPWITGGPPRGAAPALPAPPPPAPTVQKAPDAKLVKLSCKRTRSKRRAASCSVRLAGAPGGTAVSLRMYTGKRLLGAGATRLKRGRGKIAIGTKRRLKKGRYTMLITVGRRGAQATRYERRIRLR